MMLFAVYVCIWAYIRTQTYTLYTMMQTHIQTYKHTTTQIHQHILYIYIISTHVSPYMYMYVRTYMNSHVHTYMHVHMHACKHTYIALHCVAIHFVMAHYITVRTSHYIQAYTEAHTDTHRQTHYTRIHVKATYTHTHAYTPSGVHAYTHTHIDTYTNTHAYTYTHTHIHNTHITHICNCVALRQCIVFALHCFVLHTSDMFDVLHPFTLQYITLHYIHYKTQDDNGYCTMYHAYIHTYDCHRPPHVPAAVPNGYPELCSGHALKIHAGAGQGWRQGGALANRAKWGGGKSRYPVGLRDGCGA